MNVKHSAFLERGIRGTGHASKETERERERIKGMENLSDAWALQTENQTHTLQ